MPTIRDGKLYPDPFSADDSDRLPVEVEQDEWHVPQPSGPPGWNAVPQELVDPGPLQTVEQRAVEQAAQTVVPEQMTGPYDAWLGIVGKIHTTADGKTLTGYQQEIYVTRAGVHYQTNNEPQGYAVPSVGSQIGSTGVVALPWPVRHDQAEYIVAEGDIVTVLTGRDGRNWFMRDDLPFLAQVRSDGGATTEANAGGAGLTSLTVIRKALAGDPTSTVLTGFSDLQDKDSADIEYGDVLPVGPMNSAHGYRCGDHVWVFRRGIYLFCLKAPRVFVGQLQVGAGKGPAGEADFATNHYWVKEMAPTITYSTNQWTVSWAALTQTDPTGSGGRYGRWIDAENLAEAADAHALNDLAKVLVSEVGDPASQEIGYVFSREPSTAGTDIYIDVVQDGYTTVTPCDSITFAATGSASVVVGDAGGGNATVTISATDTNTDTYIGEVTEYTGGTSVAPCDKITFKAGANITIDVQDDGSNDATVEITADTQTPSDSDIWKALGWDSYTTHLIRFNQSVATQQVTVIDADMTGKYVLVGCYFLLDNNSPPASFNFASDFADSANYPVPNLYYLYSGSGTQIFGQSTGTHDLKLIWDEGVDGKIKWDYTSVAAGMYGFCQICVRDSNTPDVTVTS